MAAPTPVGGPIRVAVLSDLHLDSDVSARGRCGRCLGAIETRRAREVSRCGCGASALVAGDRRGCRAEGEAVAQRLRPGDLARAAREGGADLVLVLGDVDRGVAAVEWAAREFRGLPTVLVPGNHETSGGEMTETLRRMRAEAGTTEGVRLLDRDEAVFRIRGAEVRVLGATLWTDFALLDGRGVPVGAAMDVERGKMAGRVGTPKAVTFGGAPWAPEHALRLHREARSWLSDALSRPFGGATVVATHHGSVPEAVRAERASDPAAPAFVSDLSGLFAEARPDLVAWGHTHHDVDGWLGDTRLVSRQRGYAHELDHAFRPAVVELPAR